MKIQGMETKNSVTRPEYHWILNGKKQEKSIKCLKSPLVMHPLKSLLVLIPLKSQLVLHPKKSTCPAPQKVHLSCTS